MDAAGVRWLYGESEDAEDAFAGLQALIDSGMAWTLEGHVGRTAMDAIENGDCVLGPEPRKDYWGNTVPSRFQVEPGTKGSVEYADKMRSER